MNPFALTAEERAGAMMAPARAPDVGAFMDNLGALRAMLGPSVASRMQAHGEDQEARWDAGERGPTPLTEDRVWLADDVAGALLGPIGMAGVIKAYHGSPHRFDRFDMSKIGTGEGAQAYGHGLYFAESEGVARSYHQDLSDNIVRVDGVDVVLPDDPSLIAKAPPAARVGIHLKATGLTFEQALDSARSRVANLPKERPEEFYAQKSYDQAHKWLEELSSLEGKKFEYGRTGALYTTRLNVEPEDLLDWDKPLSEQSAKVRAALEPLIARLNSSPSKAELAKIARAKIADGTATGGDIIKGLEWTFRRPGAFPEIQLADRPAVTAALRESGVPGIRYLDQGSRAFKAHTTYKGKPYSDDVAFATREQAERWAEQKRAEGFGAEVFQDGTRNFVIFDDSLISIESIE